MTQCSRTLFAAVSSVLVLALAACGAAEPAASAPAVVVATPVPAGSGAAAAPASLPPNDGCLAVPGPLVLTRNYEDSRKRALAQREEKDAKSPPKDPCPISPDGLECRWFQARRHAEVLEYDVAAEGFRRIALGGGPEHGLDAAQRSIGGLHMLATEAVPRRTACLDRAREDLEAYITIYCLSEPPNDHVRWQCDYLLRLRVDTRRLELESLVERADTAPPGTAAAMYGEAGDGYRAMYRERCPVGIPKQTRNDRRCLELIVNTYRAFRNGDQIAKGNEARAILLDPRHGMTDTEPAKLIGSAPPMPVP